MAARAPKVRRVRADHGRRGLLLRWRPRIDKLEQARSITSPSKSQVITAIEIPDGLVEQFCNRTLD